MSCHLTRKLFWSSNDIKDTLGLHKKKWISNVFDASHLIGWLKLLTQIKDLCVNWKNKQSHVIKCFSFMKSAVVKISLICQTRFQSMVI